MKHRPRTVYVRAFPRAVLAVALAAFCGACAPEESPRVPSPPPEIQPEPQAAATALPETRDDGTALAALWLARHEELAAGLRQQPVDLLFVGDSITHYWQPSPYWQRDGGEVWESYYGPRGAFNFGVAGDTTVHVLWRLRNSDIGSLSPKVAVVNIGTNNNGVHSIEETVSDLEAIVRTLRQELPKTTVLLLGIFPRGETPEDSGRKYVAEVSRRSAGIADAEQVHFLDIGEAFLAADGMISAEIMPDFLHLTEKGYAIWARAMEPKLVELLGD